MKTTLSLPAAVLLLTASFAHANIIPALPPIAVVNPESVEARVDQSGLALIWVDSSESVTFSGPLSRTWEFFNYGFGTGFSSFGPYSPAGPAIGAVLPPGNYQGVLYVTNDAGSDTKGFSVKIYDLKPIVVQQPSDLEVEIGYGPDFYDAQLQAWLANNGGSEVFDRGVSWSYQIGALVAPYTTAVQFTATNEIGGVTTTSALLRLRDSVAPVGSWTANGASYPGSATVRISSNGGPFSATFQAQDETSIQTTVSVSSPNARVRSEYTVNANGITINRPRQGETLIVTAVATDAFGNTTVESFTVEIVSPGQLRGRGQGNN
jgi:hypothetical protein